MGSPVYKDGFYDEQGNEIRTELIDGRLYMMSPSPSFNHHHIAYNIATIFSQYLWSKKCCVPFSDGMDLYLSDENHFIPDFMIVCDRNKIKTTGIHAGVYGAPDLVVEVLSPSSAKNDLGKKKDAYEKAGVKEYWIVSPGERRIDVYLLSERRFELDNVYQLYSSWMLDDMPESQKAEIETEFKCSLFDDLVIRVADVFNRVE